MIPLITTTIKGILCNLCRKGKLMEKLQNAESLEEKKPKSYRHFIILLYEDTTSYNFEEVLQIIRSQRKYAYIKHIPESDEKKEHFHAILSFENAKTKSALSKQLGVPENFISEIKSFRTICRYLTHIDNPEKYQYNLNQVIVSKCFEREYKKCFDDKESEDEIIDNIYKFIDNFKDIDYITAQRYLIQYVNLNCYDRIYKRYRFEYTEYLKNTCIM